MSTQTYGQTPGRNAGNAASAPKPKRKPPAGVVAKAMLIRKLRKQK